MTIPWSELIPTAGVHQVTDAVIRDSVRNRLISINYEVGVPYLTLYNATTFALVSRILLTAITVVSGNDDVQDRSLALGADGFLYMLTDKVATPKTNAKLSKINLDTLLEVSALHTTLLGNTAQYSSIWDFYLTPFTSAGVQYVALLQDYHSASVNYEVVNTATMTSAATATYAHSGQQAVPCTGVANDGNVFIMVTDFAASPVHCYLIKAHYTSGGGLVMTTLKDYAPTDFNASATDIYNSGAFFLNPVNSTLLFFCTPLLDTRVDRLYNLNLTTGAVIWERQDTVVNDYYTSSSIQYGDFSLSTLGVIGAGGVQIIDLTDGTDASNRIYHNKANNNVCPLWLGATNTLVAYGGNTNGWGTIGIDDYVQPYIYILQGGVDVSACIDFASPNYVYTFREANDFSGYVMQKRNTVTGTFTEGDVTLYPNVDEIRGSLSTTNLSWGNQVSVGGGGLATGYNDTYLYLPVTDGHTAGSRIYQLVQFNKSTLNVVDIFPGPTYTYGTHVSAFTGYVVSSYDGAWIIHYGIYEALNTSPVTPLGGHLILYNATTGLYGSCDLTTLGINGDCEQFTFDPDGNVWLLEQVKDMTGTNGLNNFAAARLHKCSISNPSAPALTLLDTFTVPTDYTTHSTFTFTPLLPSQAVNYCIPTDEVLLWFYKSYLSTGTGVNQGWCVKFDAVAETFSPATFVEIGLDYTYAQSPDFIGFTNKTTFLTRVDTPVKEWNFYNTVTAENVPTTFASIGFTGTNSDSKWSYNKTAGTIYTFDGNLVTQNGENGDTDGLWLLSTSFGYTFSEFWDETYHDWKTADVSELGADFDSFLDTYYHITDDTMFWLYSPFVYLFLENSDVWDDKKSLLMRGAFDWSNSAASNKWSAQEQVYRFRNNNLVAVSRKKVRGKGRSLQLRFNSEEGKDFNLLGWGIWVDKRTRP